MILLAILNTFLSGCVSSVETRLEGYGPGAVAPAVLTVPPPDPSASSINPDTRSLIEKKLAARGFTFGENGDYILEFAQSIRPADIAIFRKAVTVSAATLKKGSVLQSCKQAIHRLTLVVLKQSSGAMAYRGYAEEYHCRGTMVESLPYLVDALVADLGNPGHGTRIKRLGRN